MIFGIGGAVTEDLAERYPVPVVRVGIADCFTDRHGCADAEVVAGARRARCGSRGRAARSGTGWVDRSLEAAAGGKTPAAQKRPAGASPVDDGYDGYYLAGGVPAAG